LDIVGHAILDLKIVDFNHYAAQRTTPSYQNNFNTIGQSVAEFLTI